MTGTAVEPAGDVLVDEPGDGTAVDPDEEARQATHDALNPCKVCGTHQHEGPEGALHVFEHCWRCGFRGNQPVPAGVALAQPGLSAGQIDSLMAELRRGIVEDVTAALKSGASPEDVSVRLEGADQPQGAVPPPGEGGS